MMQAHRQADWTDGRIFGLLDYCTILDGNARVDACHAAGSEFDQVRKL